MLIEHLKMADKEPAKKKLTKNAKQEASTEALPTTTKEVSEKALSATSSKSAAPPPSTAPVKSMIDQYSDEQIQEVHECFKLFDKTGTDSISSNLVISILRSLGLNPLERDVNSILQQEGLVSKEVGFEVFFTIFHHFVTTSHTELKENDVLEALNTLSDKKGSIAKHSVVTLLTNLGESMDREQLEGMIDRYVNQANGTINVVPWVYNLLRKPLPGEQSQSSTSTKK